MDRNCLSDTTINTLCLEVLASAKKILGERLEKVILYGSYARRDYEEESDIDFFILADIPQEEANRWRETIRKQMPGVDLEYDVLVSLHVTGLTVFNKYKNTLPFYANILNEGVEINV